MSVTQIKSKLLQAPVPHAEVVRTASTIEVRAVAKGFSEYRYASGANLARILQRLDSNVDFLMITSFKAEGQNDQGGTITLKENINTFTQIPGSVRTLLGTKRIGAYWLVGHWTTCTVEGATLSECEAKGGEIVDSLEYSWLLTRDDEAVSPEDWLEAATQIAAKFDQNSFIIRLAGETTQRAANGTVQRSLSTKDAIVNAWQELTVERSKATAQGYSEVRKMRERGRLQPLLMREVPDSLGDGDAVKTSSYRVSGSGQPFGMEFFMAVPNNNSGGWYFDSLGVRVHL